MHRSLSILIFGTGLLAVASCASYTQETSEMRTYYHGDRFDKALQALDKSDLKEQNKNRLLYRLEKAMILDRLGERKKSRALLLEADKIADELYTTSISRTAASFVVNDSTTDYSGEDYEKVAIHTELALSFLQDQDLSAAGVEARKINNKLSEINSGYDDQKNRYAEDAFARYLSGMIHEASGNHDDAIIDYMKALKLYEGSYKDFYDGTVPPDLVIALYRICSERQRTPEMTMLVKKFPAQVAKAKNRDPGAGELIVIHEVGLIAHKTTAEFVVPIGGQVVRFSFPVIRRRDVYLGQTGVDMLHEGGFVSASNLQDMQSIASFTLEDKRLRMIVKQGVRLLAKGQLTDYAYKQLGPLGGIAANVYSVVTETADTRSWTLLPGAYYVTRIQLKPGEHQIKIKNDGHVSKIVPVKVEKGRIKFIRDIG